jgi:DNA integrity scanning protein DisA with diadenylate cyclase activity
VGTQIETRHLIEQAFALARSLNITKLLVKASGASVVHLVEKARRTEKVIWFGQREGDIQLPKEDHKLLVDIPSTYYTQLSEIKMAMFLAVVQDYVETQEVIICLTGVPKSRWLNMILLNKPPNQLPWLRKHSIECVRGRIPWVTLGRILQIALQFASEGREGRSIGTTFVIGDATNLAPYLRQLIINPCEGHPRRVRNIHNPEFLESLRELSALDGAFVIDRDGVIESAGTYLDAPGQKSKLRKGFGARHASAAGITMVTEGISVVISASSKMVTLFSEGETVLELDWAVESPERR